MPKSYVFTTTQANTFLFAVGEDETAAQAKAEQAVKGRLEQALVGKTPEQAAALAAQLKADLVGRQEVNHSVIVSLDVTILSQASSDDVLLRKLTSHFEGRARLELRNEAHGDGLVSKRFWVNDRPEIVIKLNSAEQAEAYEAQGLGNDDYQALVDGIEAVLVRRRPAIGPVREAELAESDVPGHAPEATAVDHQGAF